ncbi:MAG: DUF2231 domain-containing protein [Chloroflexia bacterium]
MESKVKLAGHPIHPMLIVFPLGLFVTATVFDLVYMLVGHTSFSDAAYWMSIAGIVGRLAAALFGFLDYLNVPAGTLARQVGMYHGIGNVVVVALFAVAVLMRWGVNGHLTSAVPFALEVIGVLLAAVTGWLGGELVDRLGVGVDNGANLNAPSSLSGELASATGVGQTSPPSGTQAV